MAKYHFFQPQIAAEYGINAAILLEHIGFWIEKNEANGTNYFDGNHWTFNSVRALCLMFPYMTDRAIRLALKKLIDDGLLMTGNYNKSQYDRTLWYALTDKGKSYLQNAKFDLSKSQNGSCENVKPIPDINTDIDTDKNNNIVIGKKKRFVKPTVEEIEAYCKERDNGIDAERFWDYYEARGWAIGKNQMKDWKAAVRTWEKNNRKENTNGWHNVTESDEDDAEWHTAEWWGVKSVPLD